jgi:hypothetical protein
MKKIALFLFYSLFFLAMLLFFTPKENLYYFAEEQLKPLGIVIGYEEVIDHGFSLEIKDAKLYVQKIKSANIASTTIHFFGLYNTITIKNIILDSTFEQFFPPLINHVTLHESIFSPQKIVAEAIGDFGEAHATVNLLDRNISVIVKPSKLMRSRYRNTLRQLKKTKEGDYRYESKF